LRRIRAWLKRVLLTVLRGLGHDLDPVSLDGALRRMRGWQPRLGTVIDIGASDGSWTRVCRRYFSEADYFLIEAQSVHLPALKRLQRSWPRLRYVHAAAGDAVATIYFDASDPQGGAASSTPVDGKGGIEVPMTTVDAQVRLNGLKAPFLLKLDTHGFEVPIFEGARETLAETDLIVVETYNFRISESSLHFHEMVAYLESKGFRCADLIDPLHRPHDQALWQFDLVFARAEHPLFQYHQYR
jgi:FkbM family methyltransferase